MVTIYIFLIYESNNFQIKVSEAKQNHQKLDTLLRLHSHNTDTILLLISIKNEYKTNLGTGRSF